SRTRPAPRARPGDFVIVDATDDYRLSDANLAEGYRLLAALKAERRAAEPDAAAAVRTLWPIPTAARAAVVARLVQFATYPHDLEALEAQRQKALQRAPAARPTPPPPDPPPDRAARPRSDAGSARPRPLSFTITLRHSLRAMALLAELDALNLV